jgi:hypothetical protein
MSTHSRLSTSLQHLNDAILYCAQVRCQLGETAIVDASVGDARISTPACQHV